MKPLSEMQKSDIENIKMIVFDVDGVLVPRGTKIKQVGNTTTLETKVIGADEIEQIKMLNKKGYLVNISSGRGLYMLQEMFRDILPYVSLTYECGSATWYKGKIYQHVNSFEFFTEIFPILKKINDPKIKGFEPKEFIITIHCEDKIPQIEEEVAKDSNLCTVWNGEAYDILIKDRQSKAVGLGQFLSILNLTKENVMAIGDNYNDQELLEAAGLPISADETRVKGAFFVPQDGQLLPAHILAEKVLSF